MLTRRIALTVLAAATAAVASLGAQQTASQKAPKKNPLLKLAAEWPEPDLMEARKVEAQNRPLFQQTEPLAFTLTADFKAINKDRNPESTNRYPAVLTVKDTQGGEDALKIRVSPRGHLRRMARTCDFVPLRLELAGNNLDATLFEGQTTVKLSAHCHDDKDYDQYVLREYLSYRLLNLVTPLSFRARLARGTYVDTKSGKPMTTRFGIFIENENDVARRLGGRVVELQRLQFKDVDPTALNNMMLFNYMIGNTDFSIYALHNVRIVQDPKRTLYTIPYDFDLTGFVNPPYAVPDRRLGIRTVVDRLYRGPCEPVDQLDKTAEAFRARRAEMLALLDGMKEIDASAHTQAKDYLESFFRAIAQPNNVKRTLVDGCKATPTM